VNFKGGDFLTSSERSVKSVVKRVREVSRENRRARESLSGTLRRTEAEQEWAAKRRNSRKRVGWDRPAFGSGSNRLRLLRLLAANAQVSVIRDGLPWLGNGSLGSLRVIREIGGETARRIFPAKPEGSRISKRYLATTGSRTGVAAKRRKSRKRAGGGICRHLDRTQTCLRLLRLLAANAQAPVIRDGLPLLGTGSLGSHPSDP
jgi:hypothetical protein